MWRRTIKRWGCDKQVIVDFDLRSSIVLASIDEPLNNADEQYDCKRNDAVVHVVPCYRELGWEDEKDRGDNDIGNAEQIGEPGERLRKFEVSDLRQHTTATHAVDCNWNGVAHTESSDRGRSDGVESARTAEEDTAEDDHHEQGERE